MLNFKCTLRFASALGQIFQLILANIVTLALPSMAVLAKVSGSPAKPLRHRTAKLALELNEITSMSFALLGPTTHRVSRTLTTNQLLGLKFLLLHLRIYTIFLAAEISVLTLKALIVSKLIHRKILELVIVIICRVFQSFFLINSLKLGSFKCFLHYQLFKSNNFSCLFGQFGTVCSRNL